MTLADAPSLPPDSSAETVLSASGLSKSFGATNALRGVNLHLRGGEIHALLGENGAGKSTLVKILVGAVRADSGRVELNGRRLELDGVADAIGHGIVPIYQELSLFPHLSVGENIAAFELARGARWRPIDRRRLLQAAAEALAQLDLPLDPRTRVKDLSLAERQLVEIARALAHDCSVLVLDEPTASLTSDEAERLFAAMRRMRAHDGALLFISHRLDEVMTIADRVSVLRDGRVELDGRPRAELSRQSIVRAMIGHEGVEGRADLKAPGHEVLLAAKELAGPGFSGFSLSVREGEIVGVVGLIGSGAAEVGRVLAADAGVVAGTVSVRGRALKTGHRTDGLAAGVGYLPGDRALNGIFCLRPVRENASASILGALARHGWLSPTHERISIQPQLDALSVRPANAEILIDKLSGGNQQKVLVSRMLASEGLQVIVAVEPTRGVDIATRERIHRALINAAGEGIGVVVASSDLDEIRRLCHRILVMRGGSVTAELAAGCEPTDLLAHLVGAAEAA